MLDSRPDRAQTVLAHGCFDILHAGHIEHLRDAKKHGTTLFVSVTSDRFVRKGLGRPHFTAEERAEHLRALSFVDGVLINDAPTAVPAIDAIRPAVFVKGIDYTNRQDDPGLAEEIEAVKRCGGRFEATQAAKFSSSRIFARAAYGDEIGDYLDGCRSRGFLDRIMAAFEMAKNLNVAFVGETIIDEYRYVAPLGKASKEFVLVVSDEGREEFQGGVIAARAHAAKICYASLSTQLGSEIRKTRFVSKDFGRKLFEVYSSPSLSITERERFHFEAELRYQVNNSDAIVLLDFGHGLIDDAARAILKGAKFLAVNAQSNAGNHGYNSVAKYRHAHYVCVDTQEARLAVRDQYGDISAVVGALDREMEAGHVIVTGGKDGAYFRSGRVPAFTTSPKDTIGAGDAFLAVTAPLIAAGLGDEEAAFVGNVAGAMKTEIVGHRAPIDGDVLIQSVKAMLQ